MDKNSSIGPPWLYGIHFVMNVENLNIQGLFTWRWIKTSIAITWWPRVGTRARIGEWHGAREKDNYQSLRCRDSILHQHEGKIASTTKWYNQ